MSAFQVPRAKASFLGTVRFASRACHYGQEQGRKDDLESWVYLLFDLFDIRHGLQWKKVRDRREVRALKEIFFKSKCMFRLNSKVMTTRLISQLESTTLSCPRICTRSSSISDS